MIKHLCRNANRYQNKNLNFKFAKKITLIDYWQIVNCTIYDPILNFFNIKIISELLFIFFIDHNCIGIVIVSYYFTITIRILKIWFEKKMLSFEINSIPFNFYILFWSESLWIKYEFQYCLYYLYRSSTQNQFTLSSLIYLFDDSII